MFSVNKPELTSRSLNSIGAFIAGGPSDIPHSALPVSNVAAPVAKGVR